MCIVLLVLYKLAFHDVLVQHVCMFADQISKCFGFFKVQGHCMYSSHLILELCHRVWKLKINNRLYEQIALWEIETTVVADNYII